MNYSERGVSLIAAERTRQVEEKGFDEIHDADHDTYEFVSAAAVYIGCYEGVPKEELFALWPWDRHSLHPEKDNVKNLVKAGALIAAAIDKEVSRAVQLAISLGEIW